ncbi:MAG: iron-sulfur cluster assembly scaffold protein [Burkholderiaceae bacterium]
MVYSDALRDHFEQPRHVGAFDDGAEDVGTGMAGSAQTGGVLRMQLRVDETGVITDTCFKAYGPPALIAAGSWLAETIRGGVLEQAAAVTHKQLVSALSLPPARQHCALMAEEAIQAAIQDYKDKQRIHI